MKKTHTSPIHAVARALTALLLLLATAPLAHAGDIITVTYDGKDKTTESTGTLPSRFRLANELIPTGTLSWSDLSTSISFKSFDFDDMTYFFPYLTMNSNSLPQIASPYNETMKWGIQNSSSDDELEKVAVGQASTNTFLNWADQYRGAPILHVKIPAIKKGASVTVTFTSSYRSEDDDDDPPVVLLGSSNSNEYYESPEGWEPILDEDYLLYYTYTGIKFDSDKGYLYLANEKNTEYIYDYSGSVTGETRADYVIPLAKLEIKYELPNVRPLKPTCSATTTDNSWTTAGVTLSSGNDLDSINAMEETESTEDRDLGMTISTAAGTVNEETVWEKDKVDTLYYIWSATPLDTTNLTLPDKDSDHDWSKTIGGAGSVSATIIPNITIAAGNTYYLYSVAGNGLKSYISVNTFTYVEATTEVVWIADLQTTDEDSETGTSTDNNRKLKQTEWTKDDTYGQTGLKFTFGGNASDWTRGYASALADTTANACGSPIDSKGVWTITASAVARVEDKNGTGSGDQGESYSHDNAYSSGYVYSHTYKLPARGAYVMFEPTMTGTLTVWGLQAKGTSDLLYLVDERNKCQTATSTEAAATGASITQQSEGYYVSSSSTTTASYVKYEFPLRAGKTYFLCAVNTKFGVRAIKYEVTETTDDDGNATNRGTFTIDSGGSNSTDIGTAYTATTAETYGAYNATLTRSFDANKWTTLVLPFSVGPTALKTAFGNDVDVLHFTSYDADNKTINLDRHFHNMVVAGTPVFIRPTTSSSSVTFNGVQIDRTDIDQVGNSTYYMTGSYNQGSTSQAYDYYLGKTTGNFTQSSSTKTINGTKAWLTGFSSTVAGAKVSVGGVDDSSIALGIDTPQVDNGDEPATLQDNTVYTLTGQAVRRGTSTDGLPAGIYIIGGQKVAVR